MEQVALRITGASNWTYLGGDDAVKKTPEVVVRAFEGSVLFATGAGADGPDGEPVEVPVGEGRRLTGRHFFVRPKEEGAACLLSYRGI